ncbi:hypothetical protein D9611_014785 [Ephemerocybe angulata]|uniref:Uncharacterized protein n=1 Tax=Ephemerocybe angulata TaxID=980116 RepID=A0A8H5AR38_9AGAR|nr:hypothetical protein D9611_014785 [Tulosesus angulatus]
MPSAFDGASDLTKIKDLTPGSFDHLQKITHFKKLSLGCDVLFNLVWAGQQPFTGLRINIKTKDGNLDVPNGKGFKATGTSAPVKIPPSNPSMRKGCKAPLGDEDWLLVRKEVPLLLRTIRNDSAVSVLEK